MPKLKTHKGMAKKLHKRASGSIKIGHAGGRHNTGGKSTNFNRKKRSGSALSAADKRRLRDII